MHASKRPFPYHLCRVEELDKYFHFPGASQEIIKVEGPNGTETLARVWHKHPPKGYLALLNLNLEVLGLKVRDLVRMTIAWLPEHSNRWDPPFTRRLLRIEMVPPE